MIPYYCDLRNFRLYTTLISEPNDLKVFLEKSWLCDVAVQFSGETPPTPFVFSSHILQETVPYCDLRNFRLYTLVISEPNDLKVFLEKSWLCERTVRFGS